MTRTPSRPLRIAVGTLKLGIATTVALLAVGPVLTSTQDVVADRAPGPTVSDLASQASLDSLVARHDCSVDGLAPGVIPGSALIERDDRVQHVSFDEGWAVHAGDAPGALLAVCRSVL